MASYLKELIQVLQNNTKFLRIRIIDIRIKMFQNRKLSLETWTKIKIKETQGNQIHMINHKVYFKGIKMKIQKILFLKKVSLISAKKITLSFKIKV